MLKEFRAFILRGNVVDLAVAVIIGAAFGAVVKSLVDDIFMPLIAMIVLSAAITLGVAALSWTLIEKRALALKGDFAAATSRAFSLGWSKIAGAAR